VAITAFSFSETLEIAMIALQIALKRAHAQRIPLSFPAFFPGRGARKGKLAKLRKRRSAFCIAYLGLELQDAAQHISNRTKPDQMT
jgi:hypothetical protein